MIGHGKCLQEEFIELVNQCSNSESERCIMCFKEFRDEFNPYPDNNTNTSVNLHTLLLLSLDRTLDSSEHTYQVSISNKTKDNMLNEKSYIQSINELSDPSNKIGFYCKNKRKCINVVLASMGFMMDQPGKRKHTNCAGGNKNHGLKHSHSCNFKDTKDQLPSCETCKIRLSKGIGDESCGKCLNWCTMNAR